MGHMTVKTESCGCQECNCEASVGSLIEVCPNCKAGDHARGDGAMSTPTTAEDRRAKRAKCNAHEVADGNCADCWCLEATKQRRERDALQADNEKLRTALEDGKCWDEDEGTYFTACADGKCRRCEALKGEQDARR